MKRKRKSHVKPQIYFDYLDDVGKSGLVRMSSATPILQNEFPELSYREAINVLQYWIGSFPRKDAE